VSETSTSFPPRDEFRGRGSEPGIVSYAQNAEDVRLWRVFGSKPVGFYVDVGAGDPVRDSVTKLFYDAGWSGLNIEPGPLYAQLVDARPRDVTLELAVGTREGEAEFWISSPDSGFSGFERLPDELVPEGFSFTRTRIRCARLDALIDEHAKGRVVDFLKIDVEGAERDVLSSFDPETIRPTVILVEAIAPLENHPNHEDWESLLVDHGYVFAAFDGINRFYVPSEHAELIDTLAYPISVLDHYETADLISERLRAAQQLEHGKQLEQEKQHLEQANQQLEREKQHLEQANQQVEREKQHLEQANQQLEQELETLRADFSKLGTDVRRLELESSELAASRDQAAAELSAIRATVSWRVTRPLRAVRGAQLRRRRPATPAGSAGSVFPPGGFASRSPGESGLDPVFEVTGVTAAEILRRCGSLQGRRTSATPTTWTLSDFTTVSDADFVRAAHVILLNRLPGEAAERRRAAELQAGRSRLELLVRLALSPEGRRQRHPRVSGVTLRLLVATGHGIELVAKAPVLGTVVRRVEQVVRDDPAGRP